ncbi:hypothetical protein [Flavonifractor plautii]|uniref:glycine-rich domain-containing protein n=1 Tax=Flavonifractor plautii TaxID=292800 RepID=UPI001A9C02D3|nr:hypothetical protein [Flavonifractor plautii]
MAITPFEKDIEIIQKLDDEPNDVQGLTPEELKKRFDQAAIWLKEYINGTLIPAITGDGGTGGASNIGAAVDDFPGETVQEVLDAFNDALTDRYTKAETNSYVGQETENLVETVHVDLTTGVITVTKKDGSKETFDTALEKVPATMALVDEESGTYLVITNVDGSQTKTDVSKLIDTYTFQNSAEVAFSVDGSGNNKTVTASIRPASIGLDRFTLEVTQKLEQYNATSKANADAAAASAQAAKASETNAKGSETAASGSASQSAQSAGAASGSASQAAQSAGAAAASAESAQSNAAQALAAKNAAEASATLSQSWTEGGTGIREGENTNNAKYWAGVAQGAAGGGVTTFNGRSGAVVPAKGDYTAEMVGARPESWIPSAADTGAVPITEKGQPGGVATLGPDGKVPGEQLPKMDYDPAGSAAAVQQALTAHTGNKNNPHAVTAEQVGAYTKEQSLQKATAALYGLENGAVPDDVFAAIARNSLDRQCCVKFIQSGIFTSPITGTAKVVCVGGGGGGAGDCGGGGGAGDIIIKDVTIKKGAKYTVTIGAGGAGGDSSGNIAGKDGGETKFIGDTESISASGGKGAINDNGGPAATNGGGGGGAAANGGSRCNGGNGGTYGGGGGGAGSGGGDGGNGGTYGGGGGGSGTSIYGYTGGSGGSGGTYGGGGGGGRGNGHSGSGGAHGSNGGSGEADYGGAGGNGSVFTTTVMMLYPLTIENTNGSGGLNNSNNYGGGGGGGGHGGNGGGSGYDIDGGGGGGGGHGGNGGEGGSGGGGGGGYGGNGGRGGTSGNNCGGGGGGGFFGDGGYGGDGDNYNGGSGTPCSGSGGGGGRSNYSGGSGGSGVCYILWKAT